MTCWRPRCHSPKNQSRFAQEYAIDGNATQAAIRAGYSRRSAYSTAHDLLKNPEIRQLISGLKQGAALRAGINLERTLRELARIAYASLDDFIRIDETGKPFLDLQNVPTEGLSAVKSLNVRQKRVGTDAAGAPIVVSEVQLQIHDKLIALQQLLRILGAFEADNQQKAGAGDALVKLMRDVQAARSRAPIAMLEDTTPVVPCDAITHDVHGQTYPQEAEDDVLEGSEVELPTSHSQVAPIAPDD